MDGEKLGKIRVDVEIQGRTYHLLGSAETGEEYIRNVAGFVDEYMSSISSGQPGLDSLRVAVMTAVKIADERFRLERECQALREQCKQLQTQNRELREQNPQIAAASEEADDKAREAEMWKQKWQQLQEEYEKLQNEFHDWLQLIERDDS